MAKTEKPAATEPDPEPVAVDPETGEQQFEAKEVSLETPKPSADVPAPIVAADEGVAELRRQLDVRNAEVRERDAQIEAERNQRLMAERQVGAVSSSMVDQAIASAKSQSNQLRAAYVACLTAGKYDEAGLVNEQIADARANLLALQQQKQYIDMQAAQPQQRQAPPRTEQAPDRASQIASTLDQTGYPKSAEWIRANRAQVADQRGINRVDAAHQYVVNIKGLIPETPEYFARLEEELGIRQAAESAPSPRPIQTRSAPATAAPVSSSTPSLNGQTRRTTITLSAVEREHAHNVLGMTDEEYAAAKNDPAVRARLLTRIE